MWNCRVTSDKVSDYGAYSDIFDNLLGFVISCNQPARTYLDLIEENRKMYLEHLIKGDGHHEVVEPRELLFILNEIDKANCMYWAPRPYRRSGDISKEYLFCCSDSDILACIFCGCKRQAHVEIKDGGRAASVRSSIFDGTSLGPTIDGIQDPSSSAIQNFVIRLMQDVLELTTQRRTYVVHGQPSVIMEQFGSVSVGDYMPPEHANESQTPNRTPTSSPQNTSETHQTCGDGFHFQRCPLVWLMDNCTWRTKYSTRQIIEPSKFGYSLQGLQRSRYMFTEMEWKEFVQLSSKTYVMGACMDTLLKCYVYLMEQKMSNVNRACCDALFYMTYFTTTIPSDGDKFKRRYCRLLSMSLEYSSSNAVVSRVDDRDTTSEPFTVSGPIFTATQEEEMVARLNNHHLAVDQQERNESRNYISHMKSL